MRIAYFTNTYPRATDTFIQREVVGLREMGLDVFTYSVRKTGEEHNVNELVKSEKKNTFYILPVNIILLLWLNVKYFIKSPLLFLSTIALSWKTSRPGLLGLIYPFFYFQEALVLAYRLETDNIDHLHNHLGDASGTVAMIASRLSKVPYSISFHGPHIFFEAPFWDIPGKIQYSKFVTCISSFCKSQLMLNSDQKQWKKIKTIHCGVDVDKYTYKSPTSSSYQILYTGRLSIEKGLPFLFESLKQLIAEGYQLKLALVGDGPDRESLIELANDLAISEKINFLGYLGQEDVLNQIEISNIFILPSFAEGVPVSLMEAMACGVPVIGTYVGGVVELIDNEESGLLVSPADHLQLTQAIKQYLDNQALRIKVAENARDKIESEFNLEKEITKLYHLFLDN